MAFGDLFQSNNGAVAMESVDKKYIFVHLGKGGFRKVGEIMDEIPPGWVSIDKLPTPEEIKEKGEHEDFLKDSTGRIWFKVEVAKEKKSYLLLVRRYGVGFVKPLWHDQETVEKDYGPLTVMEDPFVGHAPQWSEDSPYGDAEEVLARDLCTFDSLSNYDEDSWGQLHETSRKEYRSIARTIINKRNP